MKKYNMIVINEEIKLVKDINMKPKYTGKKAKIEAIKRYANVSIPKEWTTKEINHYIGENFFGKPEWNQYHKIFKEVCEERVSRENKLDCTVVNVEDDNMDKSEIIGLIKSGNYIIKNGELYL